MSACDEILDALIQNSDPLLEIETRVVAIRSLSIVLKARVQTSSKIDCLERAKLKILESILVALGDYTTNERGDVGSLVRTEALIAMETFYKSGAYQKAESKTARNCYWAVVRLALEKLDKVRLQAAQCLCAREPGVVMA